MKGIKIDNKFALKDGSPIFLVRLSGEALANPQGLVGDVVVYEGQRYEILETQHVFQADEYALRTRKE